MVYLDQRQNRVLVLLQWLRTYYGAIFGWLITGKSDTTVCEKSQRPSGCAEAARTVTTGRKH